jgi:hypothetical protein
MSNNHVMVDDDEDPSRWYTTTNFAGPYTCCDADYPSNCDRYNVNAGAYPESTWGIQVRVLADIDAYFDWFLTLDGCTNGAPDDWDDTVSTESCTLIGTPYYCWGKEIDEYDGEDLTGEYFFRVIATEPGEGTEERQWVFLDS